MLSCTAISAFAAEVPVEKEENISTLSDDSGIALYNTDWYTFSDNSILDGYTTVSVTPNSGQALKIHTYIMSGSLKVWVRPASSSSWTSIASWTSNCIISQKYIFAMILLIWSFIIFSTYCTIGE